MCFVLLHVQLHAHTERSQILFVHLEDLVGSVEDVVLANLGDVISTLPALQTLVLRKCAIKNVRYHSTGVDWQIRIRIAGSGLGGRR